MNKNNGRLDAVGGAEASSAGNGMRGGARVYLRDFTFLSPEQEGQMLSLERRKCFDSFYPFQILPAKGVGRIEFGPITIFYGGNGSGKSTMLNIIAAKLGLLRELPFKPSPFFDWYVNGVTRRVYGMVEDKDVHVDGTSFNSSLPDEIKGVPATSRILTSEDVFEACQFVVATHSPFLLGIRGARIYDLDTAGVPVGKWTELENVREYFDFFKAREKEFS